MASSRPPRSKISSAYSTESSNAARPRPLMYLRRPLDRVPELRRREIRGAADVEDDLLAAPLRASAAEQRADHKAMRAWPMRGPRRQYRPAVRQPESESPIQAIGDIDP